MKKIFYLLMCFIFVITITGCKEKENKSAEEVDKGEIKMIKNSKGLVLYFSATGNTENVAKQIAKVTDSDIIEIIPKEKYSDADLDYNSDCRANKEQNDDNARPKIENTIDIKNYDVIYLGYPIWWGTIPKIILTLLDTYDFSGKTVIPFCTSGSTGITQSISDLKAYNKNINWLEGKRFSSSVRESEITSWLNTLNIKTNSEIYLKVNDKVLTVNLENNSSATFLKEKLQEKDITIDMHDYANFEKVGSLGFSLPTNDENITTKPGDVILYQGNQITIYYDTNTWDFTKLGHIDISQNELKDILGNDDVTITLTINKGE